MDIRRALLSLPLLCLSVCYALIEPETRAQVQTGVVVGTVAGPSGSSLPGVKVVLTDLSTGQERSVVTDDAGNFRFESLSIGRYSITASAPGFAAFHTEIQVTSWQSLSVEAILRERTGARAAPRPPSLPPTSPPPPPPPRPGVAVETPAESPKKNYVKMKVFYATDRQPSGSSLPELFYGTNRSSGGGISLGTCDVSIPRDHRVGKLESPKWWKLQFRKDPNRDVVLLAVRTAVESKFYSELASDIRSSSEKKAFVFVHGYDVTFENAARRTAQLAYDLQFQGAPIFYSWPSKGALTGYPADEATIEWVRPHLKTFLQQVATRSEATSIYLVAHSMGNRALTGALQDIVAESGRGPVPHFREVILAAPDVDAGVFRELATAIESSADRVTLYASSKDKALHASKTVHDFPRAGESGTNIVLVKGIDTIDVSSLDTDFLGHSYIAENRSVVTDIFHLIAGVPAAKRICLSSVSKQELSYWLYGPPGVAGCPVPLPPL